jgi:single-strand DNA-binding protein
MSRGINQCTFIGNLTRAIEVRETSNGKVVGNASIAINNNWVDRNGNKKEDTEFVDLVFWGKIAENMKNYTDKGSRVYVQGRLHTKTYEVEGQKRRSTQVNVDELVFLDSRNTNGNVSAHPNSSGRDDIPF